MDAFFKDKAVVVTGGTGFIGSHLCRRLVSLGANTHVLARSPAGAQRLRDLRPFLHLHAADIKDSKGVQRIFESLKPHLVFHLAADTDVRRNSDLIRSMMETNVLGTLNVLQACGPWVQRLVYCGTCEEYGVNVAPFHEEARECPVSPYSLSKVSASHLCLLWHRTKNFPVVVARPFLTYGPYQDNAMFIPALIRACLEGRDFDMTHGEQTREFNFVDDIVDGFLATATAPNVGGEIINLGNGREVRIRDVAEMIVRLTGSSIRLRFGALPYRPGEAMHFYANVGKAKRLLNWVAATPLEIGLEKTITWFKTALTESFDRKAVL